MTDERDDDDEGPGGRDGPDTPGDALYGLLCPFLDRAPAYAYGVEFGMWWKDAEALAPGAEHAQYVRTENEEQVRLACTRLGWEVVRIEPWDDGPPDNGWVLVAVRKPDAPAGPGR